MIERDLSRIAPTPKIIRPICWFATKGSGTNDARRMEELLGGLPDCVELPFDKRAKRHSFFVLIRKLRTLRPRLVVMEGTGLAGGLACLLGRLVWRIRFVVSSGDAVAPFIRAHHPILGLPFEVYERALCRLSAGFIGWTPYLCGRALTLGAPRAVTAAGWSIRPALMPDRTEARRRLRRQWGIPEDVIVVGLIGSIEWNPAKRFCYGWDLVEAAKRLTRRDLVVCIVGGGSGLQVLRDRAGAQLGRNIFLPGPVPLEQVPAALAVMDVGSLPQSVDGVGAFRYTTKLSEYLDAGLPVTTNRVPMSYDLDAGWLWRLPGKAPWDNRYINALVALMSSICREDIGNKRNAIPSICPEFDRDQQKARVQHFISELLEEFE